MKQEQGVPETSRTGGAFGLGWIRTLVRKSGDSVSRNGPALDRILEENVVAGLFPREASNTSPYFSWNGDSPEDKET